MDNLELRGVQVGPMIRLDRAPDGRLLAHHAKLAQPVEIDEHQLARWLLRYLRDEVAV